VTRATSRALVVADSGHLFLRGSTGPRIGVVEDKGGDLNMAIITQVGEVGKVKRGTEAASRLFEPTRRILDLSDFAIQWPA